ncbi:MAG: GNAT family N-acetyltransferase [Deltaproteobacteria bacterium]|nr:GNAT family N-acetyltransferase [Deltaproteobacteria bacterium]
MLGIKIAASITEFEKQEWDALIGANPFASYGWLKTVESTYIGEIDPKYIVVEEENKLSAAAVCYVFRKTDLVESLDDLLLGRAKHCASKLGISFLPAFICWPLFGYGEHLLVGRHFGPKQKRVIMSCLFDGIELEASKHELPVGFINVMEHESELIGMLNSRGYNKSVHIPLNFMEVRWSSFDGYLKYLRGVSKKAKKTVRNEINRNRKEGTAIKKLEEPEQYEERLHELLNMNYYKHNRRPFSFSRDFFRELKSNLGNDVVFYVSWKAGVLTGVSVDLLRNGTIHMLAIGVDQAIGGRDYTYFNLGYYSQMMDAALSDTRRIYAGRGAYETKAIRGFKTANLYIYYKTSGKAKNVALKLWFAVLSAWNRYKLPERVKRMR